MWLAHFLIEKHQVSETSLLGLLNHGLDLMIFAFVVFDAGEGRFNFLQEMEQFLVANK